MNGIINYSIERVSKTVSMSPGSVNLNSTLCSQDFICVVLGILITFIAIIFPPSIIHL